MKFSAAVLMALFATVDAVKIERNLREKLSVESEGGKGKGKGKSDTDSNGKTGKGKGKNGGLVFDDVNLDPMCAETCLATCALPDCIPLDASAAPSEAGKGKGGKGKGKSGSDSDSKSGKGKGGKGKGSSEAPVSFTRSVVVQG